MLADRVGSIHFGKNNLERFTKNFDLTPGQGRHMYTQKRGNLLASPTTGAQRYLHLVGQSNHGMAEGQDADEHMENVEPGVDADADGHAMDSEIGGSYNQLVHGFLDEIDVALRPGHFRGAAALQQVVPYVLDNIHGGNPSAQTQSAPMLSRNSAVGWQTWHRDTGVVVPQRAVRLKILSNNLRADTRDRTSDGT